MAVKTSDIQSSVWAACDELRGGLDASQYKDYILPLVFLKYATDKYLNDEWAEITVYDKEHDPNPDPEKRTGCSFNDLVALKRTNGIGDGMDKVFARFAEENEDSGLDGMPKFNDEAKMGSGKEQIDRLSNLIEIFQTDELDFSKNTAEADDIIGDVFEYLLGKFAADAGKSKGQFYTPDGAARVLAHYSGIGSCNNRSATILDPAMGSGSLLMKTIDAAPGKIDGYSYNPIAYGQEKDISTASLAKMNALIHGHNIRIRTGNTITTPKLNDAGLLQQYDYVVCNPPYSMSAWANGLDESNMYGRFSNWGALPPDNNGDFAWLLHIIACMKDDGHASVVLPLGVLFRGKSEQIIRSEIVKRGYITHIAALAPNQFFGTGIPVCIISLSKGENKDGICFIDGSTFSVKDKDKNRMNEKHIKKLCDLYDTDGAADPRYARYVSYDEIEANDYNLNVSLYVEPVEKPIVEDIEGHLHGGIPNSDLDRLDEWFQAFPGIREDLFTDLRDGYRIINPDITSIREAVENDERVKAHEQMFANAVKAWREKIEPILRDMPNSGKTSREMRGYLAKMTMDSFEGIPVIDPYDAYEVFMSYWQETMKDDVFPIIGHYDEDGELVGDNGFGQAKEIDIARNKKGKESGWEGTFLPKHVVMAALYPDDLTEIDRISDEMATYQAQAEEMLADAAEGTMLANIAGDDGKIPTKKAVDDFIGEQYAEITTPEIELLQMLLEAINAKDISTAKEKKDYLAAHADIASTLGNTRPNKNDVMKRIRSIQQETGFPTDEQNEEMSELLALSDLLGKMKESSDAKKKAERELDAKARKFFEDTTDAELEDLMVSGKWLDELEHGLLDMEKKTIQDFTTRLGDLATRYSSSLVSMSDEASAAENKVKADLARMGIVW